MIKFGKRQEQENEMDENRQNSENNVNLRTTWMRNDITYQMMIIETTSMRKTTNTYL